MGLQGGMKGCWQRPWRAPVPRPAAGGLAASSLLERGGGKSRNRLCIYAREVPLRDVRLEMRLYLLGSFAERGAVGIYFPAWTFVSFWAW